MNSPADSSRIQTTPTRPPIVVDASFVSRAILPSPESASIQRLFAAWYREERRLLVPDLLIPEVTTAVRRLVHHRALTPNEGEQAVPRLFGLAVECVAPDEALVLEALRWAGRLGQSGAYDALYVALAQREAAEFWTADEHLVHTLARIGGVRAYSPSAG